MSSATVSPDDYVDEDVIFEFDECDIRQCVNVTIVDDEIDETDERFFFTLERGDNADERIDLDPVDGEVIIEDEDG